MSSTSKVLSLLKLLHKMLSVDLTAAGTLSKSLRLLLMDKMSMLWIVLMSTYLLSYRSHSCFVYFLHSFSACDDHWYHQSALVAMVVPCVIPRLGLIRLGVVLPNSPHASTEIWQHLEHDGWVIFFKYFARKCQRLQKVMLTIVDHLGRKITGEKTFLFGLLYLFCV